MFVQNLNERQRGVLLHYADQLMRADRSIDASELMAMDMLRAQAEPGVKAEDVPIEKLSGLFEDRLRRMSFLLALGAVRRRDIVNPANRTSPHPQHVVLPRAVRTQ